MNSYIDWVPTGSHTGSISYLKHSAQAKNPSSIVHMADTWRYFVDNPTATFFNVKSLGVSRANVRGWAAHAGGRNNLYLDGHVETQNKVTVVIASGAERPARRSCPTGEVDLRVCMVYRRPSHAMITVAAGRSPYCLLHFPG